MSLPKEEQGSEFILGGKNVDGLARLVMFRLERIYSQTGRKFIDLTGLGQGKKSYPARSGQEIEPF